jgi:hypothetical protein
MRVYQRSPNDTYPPLRLRIAPPPEPGFILEQVPVRRVSEIWRVLDVSEHSMPRCGHDSAYSHIES